MLYMSYPVAGELRPWDPGPGAFFYDPPNEKSPEYPSSFRRTTAKRLVAEPPLLNHHSAARTVMVAPSFVASAFPTIVVSTVTFLDDDLGGGHSRTGRRYG